MHSFFICFQLFRFFLRDETKLWLWWVLLHSHATPLTLGHPPHALDCTKCLVNIWRLVILIYLNWLGAVFTFLFLCLSALSNSLFFVSQRRQQNNIFEVTTSSLPPVMFIISSLCYDSFYLEANEILSEIGTTVEICRAHTRAKG